MTQALPNLFVGVEVRALLWFGWDGSDLDFLSGRIEDLAGVLDRAEERAYLMDLISRPGAGLDSLTRAREDLEYVFGVMEWSYDKSDGEMRLVWRPKTWASLERLLLKLVKPGLDNRIQPAIREPSYATLDPISFEVSLKPHRGRRIDFITDERSPDLDDGEHSLEALLRLFRPIPSPRGPFKLPPDRVVARVLAMVDR